MNYEMKVRMLVAFLSFLIGMTLGWLTGESELNRWWIFSVDIIFFGLMVFFAATYVLKDLFKK